MTRAVASVALLAVLAAGAAAVAMGVRWTGGLGGGYGNAIGTPVRVGAPFSIGVARLSSGNRIRIEAVRLDRATPGIILAGALVGRSSVGSTSGFPPSGIRRVRRAVGAVLPAHSDLDLVVGLRATDAGRFRVHGIDLIYRERWHGVELRRRAHLGPEIDVCAVRQGEGVPRCSPPSPEP